jgi:hypothetical protein
MVGLSVWILVLVTGPITARVQQPFYLSQQECQKHESGGYKCIEFVSRPDAQSTPQNAAP